GPGRAHLVGRAGRRQPRPLRPRGPRQGDGDGRLVAKSRIITDPLTGQRLTFLETAADTAGRSLRAEVRLEPDGFVPRHVHLRQHERLEVLTGSVRLRPP